MRRVYSFYKISRLQDMREILTNETRLYPEYYGILGCPGEILILVKIPGIQLYSVDSRRLYNWCLVHCTQFSQSCGGPGQVVLSCTLNIILHFFPGPPRYVDKVIASAPVARLSVSRVIGSYLTMTLATHQTLVSPILSVIFLIASGSFQLG